MNKNKKTYNSLKKTSIPHYLIVFTLLSATISIFVFFSYFKFTLNTEIKNWLDTATYFNNLLSPLFLIVSTMLIYITYQSNMNEIKRQKEIQVENQKEIERQRKVQEQTLDSNNIKSLFETNFPIIKDAIESIYNSDCKFTILDVRNHTNYKQQKSIKIEDSKHINLRKEVILWMEVIREGYPQKLYDFAPDRLIPMAKNSEVSLHDLYEKINNTASIDISNLNQETSDYLDLYIENCSMTFKEYSECRFNHLSDILSSTEPYPNSSMINMLNKIEYITCFSKMMNFKYKEKEILSKYIYHNLGRYEIYSFLDLTYHKAYIEKNNEYRQYFKESFDEIAQILIINEPESLYMHRLSTKFNPNIIDTLVKIKSEMKTFNI